MKLRTRSGRKPFAERATAGDQRRHGGGNWHGSAMHYLVDSEERSALELSHSSARSSRVLLPHAWVGFDADDERRRRCCEPGVPAHAFPGGARHAAWLYKIATNVCIDTLRGRTRREWPCRSDRHSLSTRRCSCPSRPNGSGSCHFPMCVWTRCRIRRMSSWSARPSGSPSWLRCSTCRAPASGPVAARRRCACGPAEVAQMLETSVAAVNSAHQRARATLATCDLGSPDPGVLGAAERRLLADYVSAFERYDLTALVSLLHDDAVMSMPPYPMWLQGPGEIARWMLGPGQDCRGSRLIPTAANGRAAFGQYKPDGHGGFRPFAPAGDRDLRPGDFEPALLPRHERLQRVRPARSPAGHHRLAISPVARRCERAVCADGVTAAMSFPAQQRHQ